MTLTAEQIRKTLAPPIIFIDPNRSEIDVRGENFLFCSTGFESKAYKNTFIVDSNGTSFKIKSVSPFGKIKFWTSIKYFSPVREVLPNIEGDITTISLDEFKNLIIQTISKKPSAWASLDTVKNIKSDVNNCKTYKEVMAVFNLKFK